MPRGASQQILDERIAKAISTLNESGVPVTGADGPCPEPSSLARFPFRHKPEEAQVFWDMRKGLIPEGRRPENERYLDAHRGRRVRS